MSRPQSTSTVEMPPPVNKEAYTQDVVALRTVQTASKQDEIDEVLAAGLDIGRIEALDFILTVGNAALLAAYDNIKKSKGWRFIRNPKNSHGENFSSLEEFCEIKLGKSYKRLQAISSNRDLLGQEAFEQAEKLGLRQRDYNVIKALPAPDQELLRRAVEEEDSRDAVLDLMQELAERHGRERAKQQKALDNAQAEQRALERRNSELSDRNHALTVSLEKMRLRTAPWEDRVSAFKAEIKSRQALIDEGVGRHLEAIEALDAWLNQELSSQDGYDPEADITMPVPVQTVLIDLDNSIEKAANMVAAARAALHNKFGHELNQARAHVLDGEA